MKKKKPLIEHNFKTEETFSGILHNPRKQFADEKHLKGNKIIFRNGRENYLFVSLSFLIYFLNFIYIFTAALLFEINDNKSLLNYN